MITIKIKRGGAGAILFLLLIAPARADNPITRGTPLQMTNIILDLARRVGGVTFNGGSAVTQLNTGYGLVGGPITNGGTIKVDSNVIGTVTQVATGYGLEGGPFTRSGTVSLKTNLWRTNVFPVMQPVFQTNRVLYYSNSIATNTEILYSETVATANAYVLQYVNHMDDGLDGVIEYSLRVQQPAFGSNTFQLTALDDTSDYVGSVLLNPGSGSPPYGASGTRVFHPTVGSLFWLSNYSSTSQDGGDPPVSNVFSCVLYKSVTITNLGPP